ncbi:MAG: hypothetical protein HFG59_13675 [Lachnospiraceae bacterium]|nr:hypothetical protein [Lachnospiraceae bacterium]
MAGTEKGGRNVLSVHMMGDFWITLNGERIQLPGGMFSKTMNLFILMLLYGEEGIPRRKVLELLYGEEADNDSGRLRVVAFRLKRQLIAAGLMTKEDQLNDKGIFRWMPEGMEIQVDARMFELTAARALGIRGPGHMQDLFGHSGGPVGEEQKKLLLEACRLYEGELLTDLTSELWAAENQLYYQELYFQCVRGCVQVFSEEGQYDKVLTVARKAARLYPYEEWYIAELDALMGMGRWKDALEASEQSVRFLSDEMGIHPSRDLTERIRRINAKIKGSSRDLAEIREELKEPGGREGGLCCDYLAFSWIYRYEMRRLEQKSQCPSLMLCSVTKKSGEIIPEEEDEALEQVMWCLGEAVGLCLGRRDIYTRYQKNQYLALLAGASQEDCSLISSRIEGRFRGGQGMGRYRVHFFHASVLPEEEGKRKKK